MKSKRNNHENLAAIAQSPSESYRYAHDILKGRFKAGEAAIATDAGWAYCYAHYALKGRFEKGEAAIATDAGYAYLYARDVLNGRFKDGEAAIARDAELAYFYARIGCLAVSDECGVTCGRCNWYEGNLLWSRMVGISKCRCPVGCLEVEDGKR